MKIGTMTLLSIVTSAAIIGSAGAQDVARGCEALASTSVEVLGFKIRGAIGSDDRDAFCGVLNEALKAIEGLQTKVTSLEAQLADAKKQLPPNDAILLVDRAGGCPEGWLDMAQSEDAALFAGRMPLAAIKPTTPDGPYNYRQARGAATHTLKVAEMPRHQHETQINAGKQIWGRSARKKTVLGGQGWPNYYAAMSEFAGGSKPHNNMPPYIALYFCKKEG